MQQHTVFSCFIISLISVFLNGSIQNDQFNDDNFNLYKLIQRRTSSSFTTAQRDFQNQVLKAHNMYRSRHCTPPLSLDDDMCLSAQKYAEELVRETKFVHSNLEDFGENLFMLASTQEIDIFRGTQATDSWYGEIKYYVFSNSKFSEETGHFTQVVWKESEKLGVGYAIGRHNSRNILCVVARYFPPGNVDGYFSENVLPAKC